MSDTLRIFEGSSGRRPVFRSSNLSSGLLKVVGKMVGHNYIIDGQGFPYLSPVCYYYLCKLPDKSLTLLRKEDLSDNVNSYCKFLACRTHILRELILWLQHVSKSKALCERASSFSSTKFNCLSTNSMHCQKLLPIAKCKPSHFVMFLECKDLYIKEN